MTAHEIPLTSTETWVDGVWVRTRSGPTKKAYSSEATVSIWHRVGGIGSRFGSRIATACGRGPRDGFLWPSGGQRLEVARPGPYIDLPGSVCPRCADTKVMVERETLLPDEVDIDRLATLVAERLAALPEEPR